MNISLPEGLKAFVDGQVVERGFATSSEYIRDLIRREFEREKLRALLLEGSVSPVAGPPDFERLRERIRRRAAE
jgi:antitoxin ParD1/3/4